MPLSSDIVARLVAKLSRLMFRNVRRCLMTDTISFNLYPLFKILFKTVHLVSSTRAYRQ